METELTFRAAAEKACAPGDAGGLAEARGPLVASVVAFLVLVWRYTREEDLTVTLTPAGGPALCLQINIGPDTLLARVAADVRDRLADKVAAEQTASLRLSWSEASEAPQEHGAGGTLVIGVRLPEMSLSLPECEERGILTVAHPMDHVERHWFAALAVIQSGRVLTVQDVDVVRGRERYRLLNDLSRSELRRDLAVPALLHSVFEDSARRRPDHLAVEDGAERWTYRELDAMAERLAKGLRKAGVRPGSFVAFQLPRSAWVYVALLGVLKAGGAYVPLDPEYPGDRVGYIVADAGASVLLTASKMPAARLECDCRVVLMDGDWEAMLASASASAPLDSRSVSPQDVCYVIYTSGSTGRPKGVAVEHRSAAHLVRVEQDLYGMSANDRVFQGFSLAFDAAVEEVWLAFAAGATLVVGTKEMMLADLGARLTALSISVFSTVPTLLATIEGELPTVRILILGGEACPQALADRWTRGGRALFNTYGPTETTVIATCHRLVAGDPVTIGRPIQNYVVYILDERGRLVPQGSPGELCIGGPGVARGYVGQPELTAARFIRSPFGSEYEAPILYRTGDRARFDAEGRVQFLGRLDDQVKLRGFRIELGEIEAALLASGSVAQAVVTVRKDTPTGQQLVAYVVPSATHGGGVDEATLRDGLRRSLAPYMVPAYIEVIEALPTLTSGKVNKKALPPPLPRDASLPAASGAEPIAASEVERRIARAFATLFGVGSVPRSADFFDDLPGDSLMAAQLVSLLRHEPDLASLSVGDLYRHPTVEKLAAYSESALRASLPTEPPAAEEEPHELAASARYWSCGAVQLFPLYVMFALYGLQLEGPYLAFGWLRRADAPLRDAILATFLTAIAIQPFMLVLGLACKWLVIGRYQAGRYPLWGFYYFRWWLVNRVLAMVPTSALAGTPLLNLYYRMLGARIGRNVWIGSDSLGAFDLVSVGDGSTIGVDANVSGCCVEDGMLIIGRVAIGHRCHVGSRSVISDSVELGSHCTIGELSMVPRGATVPAGEYWIGSPAHPAGEVDADAPVSRTSWPKRMLHSATLGLLALLLPAVPVAAITPGLVLLNWAYRRWDGEYTYLILSPIAGVSFVLLMCLEIGVIKWACLGTLEPGRHDICSVFYVRKWLFDQLMQMALNLCGALYGTVMLAPWYRLLGVDLGVNSEFSTATGFMPDLLHIGRGAFVADAVSLGVPLVDRGFIYAAHTRLGSRSFVGNSAIVPAGAVIGEDCLVACLSAPPVDPQASTKKQSSWFGSPAIVLPRRETRRDVPAEVTYEPTRWLLTQRLILECIRVTLPTTAFVVSTCLVITTCIGWYNEHGLARTVAAFPMLYAALGAVSAALVVALKWMIVGRYRPVETPLWSSLVWRSELVTALHENLANPFFVERLVGTPFCAWFFRALGMRVGRRVFMGTTEFTEYDLLDIGDYVCLNNDCTLQTHLFEDRVMKMGRIRIERRCTVGEDAIVLYDTRLEEGAHLGPLSLVMKGERLPGSSRWAGIPARAPSALGTALILTAVALVGCARAPQATGSERGVSSPASDQVPRPESSPSEAPSNADSAREAAARAVAADGGRRYSLPEGCVPAGSSFACNPLTNEGCSTARGETCDDDEKGGFKCYPPPNDVGEGGDCNDKEGPSCAAGMACDTRAPNDPHGMCRKLCCAASACGATHRCVPVDPDYGTFGFCK